MTPKNVDHLVLEVRDMEKSLAFYCGLLGLPAERLDLFQQGQAPFVSVRAGTTLVDLFPSDNPSAGPPHFCVEFSDPIEEIIAALKAHGIDPGKPKPRFGARGTGLSVYVYDPDGHQVEIRTYHA
ncbi:VOC family protein [Sulfobacillus harzensis]|uniref:VOC family virulence protein n=1 Tax=Sulfobacillus harzensis TaxID=2729629 RepID=A0A7Y0L0P2_9FIRM|nr:VOC family protein [Sulfobacillus harzensis]NMP20878.1 VOC family virulence protein [Sulfobacillus harzensis]